MCARGLWLGKTLISDSLSNLHTPLTSHFPHLSSAIRPPSPYTASSWWPGGDSVAIETKEHLWRKKLTVRVKTGIIMLPPLHPSLTVEGKEPQAQKMTHRKSWHVNVCPTPRSVLLPCPIPPPPTPIIQFTSRMIPRLKGLSRTSVG